LHFINYNGILLSEAEAPATVDGSVFRFSEGLFESMLSTEGRLQLSHYHFDRLMRGMHHYGYPVPSHFTQNFLEDEVTKTIEKNGNAPCSRVRFQVKKERQEFHFLVECTTIAEEVFAYNSIGWKLGLIDSSLKAFDLSGNHKNINIPLYTRGADMASQSGWNDILLVHNGWIVESGGANIFWVKNGVISTPPLSEGCIEGTMRRYVIESLNSSNPVKMQHLSTADLLAADEVFLTNAVRRLKWVAQIGSTIYSNALSAQIYGRLFS